MFKQIAIAAVILSTSIAAHAESPWVKTDVVKTLVTTQTNYVAPTSVRQLKDGHISVFMRATYSPALQTATGSAIQASLVQAEIDCKNMTYGNIQSVSFAADGEPVMGDIGSYNAAGHVASMGELDPGTQLYRTARVMCSL